MNFSDPIYILLLIIIGVIYYQIRKPKKYKFTTNVGFKKAI